MQSTFERLRLILARDYKVDADTVTAESSLASLDIDSLGATELLFTIEDEFHVRLAREPVDLATVADVVAFIDDLVASQPEAATGGAEPEPSATVP